MPFIEFKCEECDNEFTELFLTFNKVTNTLECPKCKKIANKREIPSTFGFNGTDLARSRK